MDEPNLRGNEYLFGVCDLAFSEYLYRGIDYRKSSRLIEALGGKAVRNWMHCGWLMSEPGVFIEDKRALMHAIVDDLDERGFLIIGMNHTNFHPQGNGLVSDCAKLHFADPGFQSWLNDVEKTYFALAKEFPSIHYWEIDNEPNSDVFFSASDGSVIPLAEKAKIYAYFLFYASRGIHRANKANQTILGGLVLSKATDFLKCLYEEIRNNPDSHDPEDYFQIANWHPYLDDFDEQAFFKINSEIYDLILREEDKKEKTVIWSELGWSEGNVGLEKMAQNIERIFALVQKKLPFVKNIDYFRLFDELDSTWGSPAEKTYGLFQDPSKNGGSKAPGKPKPGAFSFQRMAAGAGDLSLFSSGRGNHEK